MSVEDWARLFHAQGGKCAICGRQLSFDRNTHVDHSHATGRVRGLLCHSCNTSLGHVKENPETLRRMITYLEERG